MRCACRTTNELNRPQSHKSRNLCEQARSGAERACVLLDAADFFGAVLALLDLLPRLADRLDQPNLRSSLPSVQAQNGAIHASSGAMHASSGAMHASSGASA